MSEPRPEEIVPVFAEFGSACFQAHLLEDDLRLLLMAGREYAATQVSDDAVRYPANPEGVKTLGALFHNVLTVEVVKQQDREFIWQAIKFRNRLMHDYWSPIANRRNSVLLLTPDGCREIIADLSRVGQCLRDHAPCA